jgi:hypothetical protein
MAIKARCKFYFQLDDELFADEATKNQLYYAFSGAAPVQSMKAEPRYQKYHKKAIMLLRGMILNHPFWFSEQEGADERWASILIPRLELAVERLVHLHTMYQNKKDKIGIPLEPFERLFIQLDPYVFSFEDMPHLRSAVVIESVQKIRGWLNDGTFDRNKLEQIDIPPIEPAKVAVEDELEVEGIGDGSIVESQELEQAPTESESQESEPREPEPREPEPKPVDYTIWEVFFKDGSSKYFDSSQGVWTEMPTEESLALGVD